VSVHLEPPRTDRVAYPHRFLLYRLRPFARFVIRRRYRINLHGTGHVPKKGPVIFACNHTGVIDGPLLAIFSPRAAHALTKVEMFKGFMGHFLNRVGQIKLDRFNTDPAAVRASLRVLRDGGAVGIFPEGSRGAGDLELFHRGAAYLAMVTGAPIVPVIMLGTREPGGHTNSLPARGSRLEILYGEPVRVPTSAWPRTKAAVGEASQVLRKRMLMDLAEAQAITGLTLPGPMPVGEREPDPGGGVTEKSA
jgi:1-acyl-sn-glycerol-3-phosphate acyltransferase